MPLLMACSKAGRSVADQRLHSAGAADREQASGSVGPAEQTRHSAAEQCSHVLIAEGWR